MHMAIRGRIGGDEVRQMSRNHLGQKMRGREQHLLLDESKRNKREKLRSLGRQRFKKIFLSRDQSYSQRFLICTHTPRPSDMYYRFGFSYANHCIPSSTCWTQDTRLSIALNTVKSSMHYYKQLFVIKIFTFRKMCNTLMVVEVNTNSWKWD